MLGSTQYTNSLEKNLSSKANALCRFSRTDADRDAENATGRVSSARSRSSALRPACGGLLLGVSLPLTLVKHRSPSLLALTHLAHSLPSPPRLCVRPYFPGHMATTPVPRGARHHTSLAVSLYPALRMDWDGIRTRIDHLRRRARAVAVARGMRRRTRCRVCVDVDGDGARTAGAGAVDEEVAGMERQMETSPSTSPALKLEAEPEKRVCGVGDQEEEMCAPFRVPARALLGVDGRRRRTVHKGRGWQSRCALAHLHVGVGVDGDHEALPTRALTLLHPPSPALPPSLALALTLLPPPERPPSPPLSGQPHRLPPPSFAMTRDEAAFTSLKARTDISPCDNADTTPLPVSPPSVPASPGDSRARAHSHISMWVGMKVQEEVEERARMEMGGGVGVDARSRASMKMGMEEEAERAPVIGDGEARVSGGDGDGDGERDVKAIAAGVGAGAYILPSSSSSPSPSPSPPWLSTTLRVPCGTMEMEKRGSRWARGGAYMSSLAVLRTTALRVRKRAGPKGRQRAGVGGLSRASASSACAEDTERPVRYSAYVPYLPSWPPTLVILCFFRVS
ncbi:hypothetical protein B0H13DRAFT_2356434 [Mycena leptocephala]|nr:hypothetical protein B0H13DRAFT_2356434 [Mycena leptocephala]